MSFTQHPLKIRIAVSNEKSNFGPVDNLQLVYHKSFKLKAVESVKILLGELIPYSKTHIRIDLESTPPKTLIVRAVNSKNEEFVVNHIRVDKSRTEFDLLASDVTEVFDQLQVSVPEDTQFHLGVYLKSQTLSCS